MRVLAKRVSAPLSPLAPRATGLFSPFAVISTRREACFLHQDFKSLPNGGKNVFLLSRESPLHPAMHLIF